MSSNLEQDLIRRMQDRISKKNQESVECLIEKAERESTKDLFGKISKMPDTVVSYDPQYTYKDKVMQMYGELCYKKLLVENAIEENNVNWEKIFQVVRNIIS